MLVLFRKTPILGALLAQVVALPVVAAVTAPLASSVERLPLIAIALLLQGALAALICGLLKLPRWWLLIAFLFPLAMGSALLVGNLPAWPFGLAFLVLALVFSNTTRGRVPLYLTNAETASVLKDLMRDRSATRVLDLGCGLGGVVRALDGEGRKASGVENAPAVYLAARFLSAVTGRGEIRRGDLWKTDVSQEDVVYAFLSPAPMAALWQKLSTEMKPGSLFVSNSFAVPDVDPDEIWELSDSRKTRLFLYPIGKAEKGAEAE
jgi:SAM-dependent methyltransferase